MRKPSPSDFQFLSKVGLISSILCIVISQACSINFRPYRQWEMSRFRSVKVPNRSEVRTNAKYEKYFEQPHDKVWQTCLGIAAQGGGILGVRTDSNQSKIILFVASSNLAAVTF